MRIIYDVFSFLFVALGALCVGIGLAMLVDVSTDVLLATGRYPHPEAMAIIGIAFVVGGAFGAWWARFTYNFITMTRIRM